jgi:flagellar biosynthesis protein FlhB
VSDERTEAPTPKKKEESRKKGQTATSHDLVAAAVLLAGIYGLKVLAQTAYDQIAALMVGSFRFAGHADPTNLGKLAPSALEVLTTVLPPLFGLLVCAAVAATAAQGGVLFVPNLIAPKGDRINPIAGLKRIISLDGLVQNLKTLAKFAVICATAGLTLQARMGEIAGIGALDLLDGIRLLLDLIWEVLFKTAFAMLVLGAMDWLWSRRQYLKQVRMTKQEVKEEYKQTEGDPHVKAQRRGRRQALHAEMMKSVRTADVVVTNPTHFAVALKYDGDTMAAPAVVAKGQDFLALRIRDEAKEAGVPVLENPPLARALFKLVKLGHPIPPELYVAVAEVLAFVFRLRAEREA